MRYGKKLAMLSHESRPFIAHTELKNELSVLWKTVRSGENIDDSVVNTFCSIFLKSHAEIESYIKSRVSEIMIEIHSLKEKGRQMGIIGSDITRNLLLNINQV